MEGESEVVELCRDLFDEGVDVFLLKNIVPQIEVLSVLFEAVKFFKWNFLVQGVGGRLVRGSLALEGLLCLFLFDATEETGLAGLGEVVSLIRGPFVVWRGEAEGLVSNGLEVRIDLFVLKLPIEIANLIVLGKNAPHFLVENGGRSGELHRMGEGLALGLLGVLQSKSLLHQIVENHLHVQHPSGLCLEELHKDEVLREVLCSVRLLDEVLNVVEGTTQDVPLEVQVFLLQI